MRYTLILPTLFPLLFVGIASAQTTPPFPRPRPDREAMEKNAAEANQNAAQGENESSPQTADPSNSAADAITRVLSGPPQPVTLSAKISDDGTLLTNGVVWRVFSMALTSTGEAQLLGTADTSVAVFTLTPGEYLVHAAYGLAQQTQTIIVDNTSSAHIITMDAGGLRLTAAISGDVPIKEENVRFSIFPDGFEEDARAVLAQDLAPNQIVHLNAGTYHVVSNFGDQNATVQADLRVEPGQLTEATLYHNAAKINFRLVSEERGDAIADVEWSVKNSDGDTVFSELGTFPSAILAEGDYTVLARRGTGVFNRDFSVAPGPEQKIEVLTQIYGTNG
jgi:hypothetical protein